MAEEDTIEVLEAAQESISDLPRATLAVNMDILAAVNAALFFCVVGKKAVEKRWWGEHPKNQSDQSN